MPPSQYDGQVIAHRQIGPYRDKVVIEQAFRDIKSFIKIAPVWVWSEIHVKAHYTVCVLSHFINRTMTLRLHENTGDRTKTIVSHEKMYKILSSCMVDRIHVENAGISTYSMSQITLEQKEVLNRIGLNRLCAGIIKKIKSSL